MALWVRKRKLGFGGISPLINFPGLLHNCHFKGRVGLYCMNQTCLRIECTYAHFTVYYFHWSTDKEF